MNALIKDADFVHRLDPMAEKRTSLTTAEVFVEFSAEADCMLVSGKRYRIVGLRVGEFRER